jgi:hypothetical protein
MGTAASVRPTDNNDFFGGVKIIEGGDLMSESLQLRTCFVDFVKSGLWMDNLGVVDGSKAQHEERIAIEKKNPIYAYKTSVGKCRDLDDMFQGQDSRIRHSSFESVRSSISLASTNSGNSPNGSPVKRNASANFLESYQSIEDKYVYVLHIYVYTIYTISIPLYILYILY